MEKFDIQKFIQKSVEKLEPKKNKRDNSNFIQQAQFNDHYDNSGKRTGFEIVNDKYWHR